jgi:hypothetical protein
MKKASGLRNRYRSGRGTYNLRGKKSRADDYGSWSGGVQTTDDRINGHVSNHRRFMHEAERVHPRPPLVLSGSMADDDLHDVEDQPGGKKTRTGHRKRSVGRRHG